MSSGIIDTIKKVALNAFESTNPVKLMFGKVISTDPIKIQSGEYLTLTKEFLVINGAVSKGDEVTLIRCQGGQKYVVLGTRTAVVEQKIYSGGGEVVAPIEDGWQLPYKGGYVQTAPFGQNRSGGKKHKGVDLVGANKQIYPINNGNVILASTGYNGGYGNYVIIEHGNGYWSLYAHMKQLYVEKGQTVNKNTILGIEGSTGRSTGSHLHLEVRKGSNSSSNTISPIPFINEN